MTLRRRLLRVPYAAFLMIVTVLMAVIGLGRMADKTVLLFDKVFYP